MQTNPLSQVIFECLLKTSSWKIHTLASHLSRNSYLNELDKDYNKDLFKKNFLIMNALFQLNEDLVRTQHTLIIEPLEIRLTKINDTLISASNENLKDYYLDWNNFETDSEAIKSLLNSFWQNYSTYDVKNTYSPEKISSALQFFQLPESATTTEISKRWKTLALKHHPDKQNGDKDVFQQLQIHWQVLKTTLN
ncbi:MULTISPECIES: DNA-J related domain-containing protein [unclassified Pseudoalteromonas]|uniref:DNA-J related domain-containing protein n=1 Tax=unclassified Pseudoalteromonas TaxID=194690 RepID=UPI0005AB9373|nr:MULTISPECIES: DNA-J related domain-containing protein [unclassified Pseudoalteromonas]